MKENNTFFKLLLSQGSKTDPDKVDEIYSKLSSLPNSTQEEKRLLDEAYARARRILNGLEEDKSKSETEARNRNQNNHDNVELIDKRLVNYISTSIRFKPVERHKRVKHIIENKVSVVNLGTLSFRRPSQMGDFLNVYAIQYDGGERHLGITSINIYKMCEDQEYTKAVLGKLLDKQNVEKAEKEGNYLGRLEEPQNGEWELVKDQEECAACYEFQNNRATLTIMGREDYREE